MKQKFYITGILLLGAVCAQANNYEVTSPDGRLAVKVECVDGKAKVVIQPKWRYYHQLGSCSSAGNESAETTHNK